MTIASHTDEHDVTVDLTVTITGELPSEGITQADLMRAYRQIRNQPMEAAHLRWSQEWTALTGEHWAPGSPKPWVGTEKPEDRHDRIHGLIRHYQQLLGLADWDIRYDDSPPSDGSRAEIDGWAVKRMASIRIHPEAPNLSLRRLVVHELLHLWLSQLQELAAPLMAHTPPAADETFNRAWDRVEHQLIHVLEAAIVQEPHLEFGDVPAWTRPRRA